MKILEFADLDTSRVKAAYRKVVAAIANGDFRTAQVRKLAGAGHGKLYRARLNDADRLIFCLLRHNDDICALMLEVIVNHDYEKSRFLRGAVIDEDKIVDCDAAEAEQEAQSLRYLNPERTIVHLLDKPTFDDVQDAVFRAPLPLIIVGSAGSGKTALTLEKLKLVEGEALYVTHPAYLAQNARNLYYANGFERTGQEATFLSYRDFVESIHVPAGREAAWRDFAGWFQRIRQSFRDPDFHDIDGHQVLEEIRGVITAGKRGILTREDYLALGVRQSIFGGALQCIGTSATMASEGSTEGRNRVVAEVASRLFAADVRPDNVITETLRRRPFRPNVCASILPPLFRRDISDDGLRQSPLAIWVETVLGVTRESETEPKLVRATPCTLKIASERLAADAGVDEATARAGLQNLLAVASKPEHDRCGPGSIRPFFAFMLHQFLSGADHFSQEDFLQPIG